MTRAEFIDQLFDIATNDEFTPDQRREQLLIALDEYEQVRVEQHPTARAIAEAMGEIGENPLN